MDFPKIFKVHFFADFNSTPWPFQRCGLDRPLFIAKQPTREPSLSARLNLLGLFMLLAPRFRSIVKHLYHDFTRPGEASVMKDFRCACSSPHCFALSVQACFLAASFVALTIRLP